MIRVTKAGGDIRFGPIPTEINADPKNEVLRQFKVKFFEVWNDLIKELDLDVEEIQRIRDESAQYYIENVYFKINKSKGG